jgi:hypothetical protein
MFSFGDTTGAVQVQIDVADNSNDSLNLCDDTADNGWFDGQG